MKFITFKNFLEQSNLSSSFIVSEKISLDLDTVISLFVKLQNISKNCFLFESSESANNKGRYSVIGLTPDLIWTCNKHKVTIKKNNNIIYSEKLSSGEIIKSLEDFQEASKLPKDNSLPAICSGVFGYMNYDMVKYLEKIPSHKIDEINIPESQFIRPQILIVFDNLRSEIIINLPIYTKNHNIEKLYKEKYNLYKTVIDKIYQSITPTKTKDTKIKELSFTSNFSEEKYSKIITKAKEYITAGDVFQVLPSRRFYCDFPYKGLSLYRALRSLNPSPFLFYVKFDNFEIIGSSPEILVRVDNNTVTVRPLAGTRKRGKDDIEDQLLAQDLLNDEKEKAEHLMLIDLGRNDVGRVSKDNSVSVTKFMEVEYYSHVMHISSNIEGEMLPNKTRLEALISGFPAGTVSGSPKIRAMEIISEFEPLERSFYSGCVGYFSAHQNYMDMAIMLRTSLLKDQTLYMQSGAGIVHDSIAEKEYEETENKAKAIFKAAELAANFE